MYYRNAQAALVVYDLTKPSSLVKAKHWVAELQRQASPGIVIALVGNKLDLTSSGGGGGDGDDDEEAAAATAADAADNGAPGPDADADDETTGGENNNADDGEDNDNATSDARKISTREASTYADEEGLLFFETSAKTGFKVSEVFTAIANAIPETNLKGAKTGPGAGGQTSLDPARSRDDSRVNLGDSSAAGAKEGCAC